MTATTSNDIKNIERTPNPPNSSANIGPEASCSPNDVKFWSHLYLEY
jgi:hypothetical protein